MPNLVATREQLAALAAPGQTLTEAQLAALEQVLDGVVASLELRLGRWIGVREVTQTAFADPHTGMINLSGSPVVRILELTVAGTPITPTVMDPVRWLSEATFRHDVAVAVRYEAGLNLTARPDIAGALRHAVLMKALPYAQATLAAAAAVTATGSGQATSVPAPVPGIKNFSVEGLSVGYDSAAQMAEAATKSAQALAAAVTWTDADLAPLSRLQRRVVA